MRCFRERNPRLSPCNHVHLVLTVTWRHTLAREGMCGFCAASLFVASALTNCEPIRAFAALRTPREQVNAPLHHAGCGAQRRPGSSPCKSIDSIHQPLPALEPLQVVEEVPHEPLELIVMPPRGMRSNVAVGRLPQRVVGWQRLGVGDVEVDSREFSGTQ